MNLTIREAEKLLTGLETLIKDIENLPSIYAPSKQDFAKQLLNKQTERLQKLYRELSNYVSQKKRYSTVRI